MSWYFRLSEHGKQIIKEARKRKEWSSNTGNNDQPLIAASKILEPGRSYPQETSEGKLYAAGINEVSWKRFCAGKQAISAQVFVAYCHVLDVVWENVVEWESIDNPLPFISLPRTPFNPNSGYVDLTEAEDASEFIRDVTIPDGTIMQPGEEFTKIWEIYNAGNVVWKDRFLRRIGNCSAPTLISSQLHVKIPRTEPGQSVQIAVQLKAPYIEGTKTAMWKMTYSDGRLCFPDRYNCGLGAVIQVIR